VSDLVNQLVAKRLDLLQQAVPGTALIGLLVNPTNPNAEPDAKEARAAVKVFGQKLLVVKATGDRELDAAFEALAQERADALAVNIDPSCSEPTIRSSHWLPATACPRFIRYASLWMQAAS
jgi:putative tryptophan/tyrosine transport system substrate-binding protein